MIDIDLSEVYDLAADLANVEAQITPPMRQATEKTLKATTAAGKRNAPRLTGALAASIGYDVDADGLGGEVGPTVSYGAFPEYGTSTMPPEAYMGPAADETEPGYVEAMGDAASRVLG